ncbi:MAG: hypothetical protein NZ870_00730 [bacterium]|nr:hypothetical protein [bacterium]
MKKVIVISADMGLGHERAAYALRHIASEIITAADPSIVKPNEYKFWKKVRLTYELLSRSRKVPIVGKVLYKLLYSIENIKPLYPIKDESKPTLQTYYVKKLIEKGLGRELLEYLVKKDTDVITTFYVPALLLDYMHYNGNIFCVICDSDVNRVWVSENPSMSKIKYFVPCDEAAKRLKNYGVKDEYIFITGFPLPIENIGENDEIIKVDLIDRLKHLDPFNKFISKYKFELLAEFGGLQYRKRPLTLTFAIGSAGAQVEIAEQIIIGLRKKLLSREIALNVSCGIKGAIKERIYKFSIKNKLENILDRNLRIIYSPTKQSYFEDFNTLLRTTDILWTKPSELSFYAGLGIPIILAPPIGPHEEKNMHWLIKVGAAVYQEDIRYVSQWLYDYINDGVFALKAWSGYRNLLHRGSYEIREIITGF